MSRHDVKLLGTVLSPFVMRVRIAFHLRGVPYEFVEEDLTNKSELLLKSNPVAKKVPVLIHYGRPICESLNILQYIDEAWAQIEPSIMPSEPFERSLHRFWGQYADEKFMPAMFGIFKAKTEEEKNENLEKIIAVLQPLEEAFEKLSNGKSFFGGETIGFTDLALGSYVHWIPIMEEMCGVQILVDSKTPGLVKWAEKFMEVDAVKEVVATKEVFVEYAKKLQAMLNAQAA